MYLFNCQENNAKHLKGFDFAVKCDCHMILTMTQSVWSGFSWSLFEQFQLISCYSYLLHVFIVMYLSYYEQLYECLYICEACFSLNMRRYHDDLLVLVCWGETGYHEIFEKTLRDEWNISSVYHAFFNYIW